MNRHILPPPIDEAELDLDVLDAEFLASTQQREELHMTTAHLYALSSAAIFGAQQPSCPPVTRELLQDFLKWTAKDAKFGPEMRKALALQQQAAREGVPT